MNLLPKQQYQVKNRAGQVVCKALGERLRISGFEVRLPGRYAGELLEISQLQPNSRK